MTRGAEKSAKNTKCKLFFFFGGERKHSLDVVLAVGQLGTELPDELREPEQVPDQAIVVCLDAC